MLKLSFKEFFSLTHTFECGQIFRFQTFNSGVSYYGTQFGRVIKITQQDPHTLLVESTNEKQLKEKLDYFFRTKDDYLEMQRCLSVDKLMKKVIQRINGLHLLKQDIFECSIAFILSQCSNIPRIIKNLNTLAKKHGRVEKMDNYTFYVFPTREDLIKLTEQDYRDFGFGYRAKYLDKFVKNYPEFLKSPIKGEKTLELNKKLQKIEGIGQKVSDCIQLFAFGDLNLFPVDTWMKKFMLKYYLKGKKISNKRIREFGMTMFGKWSGYAQEFIYRYVRCFDPLL